MKYYSNIQAALTSLFQLFFTYLDTLFSSIKFEIRTLFNSSNEKESVNNKSENYGSSKR